MRIHKQPLFGTSRSEATNALLSTAALLLLIALSSLGVLIPSYLLSIEREALPNSSSTATPIPDWVEEIRLNVKYKPLQRLHFLREQALRNGYISAREKETIKAKFRFQDEEVSAQIRLKGDLLDHVESDKWSLRIKLKKGSFKGMREFSVQTPETRNFLNEFLFLRALDDEGLLSHRFDFIALSINEESKGIFAYEEHFSKIMLENNRHREAPIVRFDEALWWNARRRWDDLFKRTSFPGAGDFHSLPLSAFQQKKQLKSQASTTKMLEAFSLLEGLRQGTLKGSQIFDVDKLAMTVALIDLFGAHHALDSNQLRFYLNPVTSKLELVAFDANAGERIEKLAGSYSHTDVRDWAGGNRAIPWSLIFKDPELWKAYIPALEKVSSRKWLEGFAQRHQSSIEQRQRIIQIEKPFYEFNWKALNENRKTIREFLNPIKGLKAHLVLSQDHSVDVELGNLHSLPIEVLSIRAGKERISITPFVLPARKNLSPVAFRNIRLPLKSLDQAIISKVEYRILGSREIRNERITPWARYDETFVRNNPFRQKAEIDNAQRALVEIDEKAKELRFKNQRTEIFNTLVIPSNYALKVAAGTTLNLTKGASIISYGPLIFEGTQQNPIYVTSSDSQAMGIVVIESNRESSFEHVIFSKLSAPKLDQSSWELSGALTFYASDVSFEHCQFINNLNGDDYLNIIRSRISLQNSSFVGTLADALDIDFGKASIKNVLFHNTGNDAADFSGTQAHLSEIRFSEIGDKAISAGEQSTVIAEKLTISQANIGIAAKDGSSVQVQKAKIAHTEIGFSAFQKKPEYSSASINALETSFAQVPTPHLIEEGSNLNLNGKDVEVTQENLRELFYE